MLLCEAGWLYKQRRDLTRAETLLVKAVDTAPERPLAYRLLAELYLLAGEGRRAHATALQGLARWGADWELWALVSESYVGRGDLAAAIRVREAALGADPGSRHDQAHLDELRAPAAEAPPPGDAG